MRPALTIGSLFSGIGGLELGVEHATGGRVLWQVERDEWCREVLAKHWIDAVRYDDVCTVNGLPRVDIICGGFPCQDVSLAGKRAGFSGERSSLWREYRRIVADVRPRFVFVENVPGLLTADDGWAFGEVLGGLAALGYDAVWDHFRASDMGAPHRRERIFLLAHRDGAALRGAAGAEPWREVPTLARVAGEAGLADASRVGERESADEGVAVAARGRARVEPRRGGESPVGDADGQRRAERNRAAVAERAELRGAGGAVGSDGRGGSLARVGLPADGLPRRLDDHRWPAGRGEAQHLGEPPRTAAGVPMRAAQLKALGNAVVPQCAALAWRVLSARVRSEAA